MKKLLLFAAFAVVSFTMNAQDSGDFEIAVGVGLNMSNVFTSDNQNSTDSKFSYNARLSGEYYFSESWGAKIKLVYDNKGWANGFVLDENLNSVTTDFKLTYLTIPAMASFHFGEYENWYVNFGTYAGFLLSAEATKTEEDFKDAFKNTDFGLAFGIGYKFELGDSMFFFVEYEGQSGFLDIFEVNEVGSSVKNGRSSLNIGILF